MKNKYLRGCITKDRFGFEPKFHGEGRTKEYKAWRHAKSRCFNPNVPNYYGYGGRGITMCDRWRYDYTAFLQDMGRCPEGMTLDRINNNGNYEPGNCRWVSKMVQSNNTRKNRFITKPCGSKCTIAELHRETGIKYTTLKMRLNWGWPYEELVKPPK